MKGFGFDQQNVFECILQILLIPVNSSGFSLFSFCSPRTSILAPRSCL